MGGGVPLIHENNKFFQKKKLLAENDVHGHFEISTFFTLTRLEGTLKIFFDPNIAYSIVYHINA